MGNQSVFQVFPPPGHTAASFEAANGDCEVTRTQLTKRKSSEIVSRNTLDLARYHRIQICVFAILNLLAEASDLVAKGAFLEPVCERDSNKEDESAVEDNNEEDEEDYNGGS